MLSTRETKQRLRDICLIIVIGKFFTSLLAVLGIGVIVLPAGSIAANYSKILEQKEAKKYQHCCTQ